MTEVGSGVIPDVSLHLHPAPVGVPDLLALHTDWQYSAKIRQFSIPCLVQCPLGLDSVCNIDTTAYIAPKLTVLAKEWRSRIKDPPIIPIMTLQAILHLKWFPPLKCIQVCGKAVLEIITMNTLGPSISVLLFQAASSELKPAVVEVIALSGRIGTADHDRRLLHQGPIFVSGKLLGDHSAAPLGELHRPHTSDELFTLFAINGHTRLYLQFSSAVFVRRSSAREIVLVWSFSEGLERMTLLGSCTPGQSPPFFVPRMLLRHSKTSETLRDYTGSISVSESVCYFSKVINQSTWKTILIWRSWIWAVSARRTDA